MSYRKVIESIDNWQTLSEPEVVSAAKDPVHLLVDSQRWSLLGIAQIIGDENVGPLLAFLESIGLGWIVHQAGGSGLPIGDAAFNAKLLAIPHPSCQTIAQAGRRMGSLCAKYGLPETDVNIVSELRAMKVEKAKKAMLKEASTVYNSYCHDADQYDGTPETDPGLLVRQPRNGA